MILDISTASEADVQSIAPAVHDKHTYYVKITDSPDERVVSYARWGLPHPSPAASGGDDSELNLSVCLLRVLILV